MKMTNRYAKMFVVLAAVFCLCAGPALADEITDTINEALSQYKAGQFTEAAGTLDYASQMIRQKKGGSLETLLPEPLNGWTADAPTSVAAGAAMFGGGVTAERTYYKGDSSMTVSFVTDSPVLQSMMMMMTNPAFAASSGMKIDKVKGQRAMYEYDPSDKSGEMTMVVANKFLVTVSGSGVEREEIKAYAEAVDFAKLEALQ
ncbi:MAG: hypothetical protein JEZ02_17765 [Desulfatibacillum sp.]|nr:hypothetical protein [Desulfatibacillum sp.]